MKVFLWLCIIVPTFCSTLLSVQTVLATLNVSIEVFCYICCTFIATPKAGSFLTKTFLMSRKLFTWINKGYIKFTFPNIDCSFYLWQECVFWVEMTWYHWAMQTCLTDYRPTGYYFFQQTITFGARHWVKFIPYPLRWTFRSTSLG